MNKSWFKIMLVVMSSAACRESYEGDRRQRDQSIGLSSDENFSFVADNGLLHVIKAEATQLHLRATAAEFSAMYSRAQLSNDPVIIRIDNIPRFVDLRFDQDVESERSELSPTSQEWKVKWTGHDLKFTAQELDRRNFTFLAMADIQEALPQFGEMVEILNTHSDSDFLLISGDLTSRSEPEEFDLLAEHMQKLQIPYYATPGNHDVFVDREYQARYGRASYSFTHRGVRFTSIDSASADIDPVTYEWVENWLKTGKDQTHVIFTHIPAIDFLEVRSGQWNSRRIARKFIAESAENNVDLFLFGHVHTYDQYELGGISTIISGGGGAIPEKFDSVGRHFMRIHVDPEAQTLSKSVVRVDSKE
jgi:Icc protein